MSHSNSVNICLPGDRGCCPLGTCICMLRGSVITQTSSYLGTAPTAQQAFALMSGRSPQQFQVSTSVTCRPDYHETALPQKAPSLEDIQSVILGVDSTNLALADYLSQQDRSAEPFPLVRHSVSTTGASFCDDSMGGDYTFSMDGSLGVCAPRMQPQLSSSPSGCYAGGDESSHPMTRHSRSYSNASYRSRSSCLSSQGESLSPTDHFPTQNSWAPMSRETSNASLTHGATMLRLSSSAGNSTTGSGGGGDYGSFCSKGGLDAMFGFFASEGELSSSLDKAAGQHMLKRPPSTSVEDLDHTLAIEVAHEMQRNQSTASESVKPRKPKRAKEGAESTTAAQSEGVSTTIATGHMMLEKEEQEYQASCIEGPGSPASCQNSTTANKTIQQESGDGMGTTGNLPTSSRVLAASKPSKSSPKYAAVSATKPSYTRPPHPRVKCKFCNESPDGFRGDHELRRHMEREHSRLRKMFVIKDVSEDGQFLAKCKACQSGKKYGQDYNAAAHLRRQHFNHGTDEKKKKGSFNTSYPDMAELRKWMNEVEVVVDDGEYFTEELQATDVSKADNPRMGVNKESASANEGEEESISQVSNSESAVAENSPAPAVVIQDGELGVSDVPTQHQAPFDSTAWEEHDHWYESGGAFDLSHNYGVQFSVSSGSMPLADALNRQNNAAGEQDCMALPYMHLLQGRQDVQPSARGETASTIFGNLPGPAATKDTSGIFSATSLAMMIPGSESIFEADSLHFS
ncbi:hypothetical protein B9Z19DRAFT_1075542 [Tuber borchii]|uniref:DUF7896 domain-containing protein n=1 Tax=Tuber borchii TaxID=42251 RepID=A0A2T7A3A7_TUBBO|nr:hypothetical protein B9Z19DRAFT_1075542 [Tuber borchii]